MLDGSPDPRVEFGVRLRELREKAGLSQEKLADKCALDRTYISSCERGRRNISLLNIYRIAAALKVNPEDLLRKQVKS
ncbi:XRE family transcriptional regulator [bacterium]|nr:MAG: XRE family transcriptional regulator [bacterium]